MALLLIAAAPTPPPAPPPTPGKGSVTGLPLPRFAALRSDDVNLRAGPGTRYPISWVYKRRGLPVEIEREFDVWRLIRDADGTEGWVHEATLTGRRSLLVIGGERVLREAPADNAAIVARAGPGVVGRISDCDGTWCHIQIGSREGAIRISDLWGVAPGESVDD